MAVMLNMTDSIDGFSFTPHAAFSLSTVQSITFTKYSPQVFSGTFAALYLFIGNSHAEKEKEKEKENGNLSARKNRSES
jgi:hypothetical protein